jgi:adenylate kinase family enzyme
MVLFALSTQDAGSTPRRSRLLILVGMVGSGKTTLAEAMVKTGWVRASQDDAPSKRRQECEAMVRSALQEGKDVIVDRVDFDPQ